MANEECSQGGNDQVSGGKGPIPSGEEADWIRWQTAASQWFAWYQCAFLFGAAAGGLVFALLLSRLWFGKADLTMALNGALAGLVAITAEPLTPTPLLATFIGAIGGVIVVFSIIGLDKMKLDDPVGAISVHGVVGMWGLMAVVLSNADATIVAQLTGLGVIFAWTFGASLLTWFVIKMIMGIRVSEEEEYAGVDLSECGLEAYPEFVGSQGSGK